MHSLSASYWMLDLCMHYEAIHLVFNIIGEKIYAYPRVYTLEASEVHLWLLEWHYAPWFVLSRGGIIAAKFTCFSGLRLTSCFDTQVSRNGFYRQFMHTMVEQEATYCGHFQL